MRIRRNTVELTHILAKANFVLPVNITDEFAHIFLCSS